MKQRVLLAAGGSGGHLFPACQLADLLMARGDVEVCFAGYRLIDSPFFARERYQFYEMPSAPLTPVIPWALATWKGVRAARSLRKIFPFDCVVGFGSYHTVPILAATVWMRQRLILYEANTSLGKVHRLFAPFAETIACPFPLPTYRQASLVPFFPWKMTGHTCMEAYEARAFYGLDPTRMTCLVFGGSQGAHFLNQQLAAVAKAFPSIQLIHFTGHADATEAVRALYQRAGVRACVRTFESEMDRAYSAAHIAVCRAGAGTVAELIRYQVPALVIPYPYASNHQEGNGRFFAQTVGGGFCLRQAEASSLQMVRSIEELMEKREQFQLAIGRFGQQNRDATSLDQLVVRHC